MFGNQVESKLATISDTSKALVEIPNADKSNICSKNLASEPQCSHWEKLFLNPKKRIFTFLDFQDLARLQNISKSNKKVGRLSILWKPHFHCHFVSHRNEVEKKAVTPQDYYQAFRAAYLDLQNNMPSYSDRFWLRRFKENNFIGVTRHEVHEKIASLDHFGFPFIYWTVKNNYLSTLTWIFKEQENLSNAIYCNQKDLIVDFLNKEEVIDPANLINAVSMGNIDVVKILFPYVKIDSQYAFLSCAQSIVATAVDLNYYDIAAYLIEFYYGIPLTARPKFDSEAFQKSLTEILVLPAKNNNIEMVELLLHYDVKVNPIAYDQTNDFDIIKRLLCAEIDDVIKSSLDKKPHKILGLFKISPSEREIALQFKCALQMGTEKEFFTKFKPKNFPAKLKALYEKYDKFNMNHSQQEDYKKPGPKLS